MGVLCPATRQFKRVTELGQDDAPLRSSVFGMVKRGHVKSSVYQTSQHDA